MDRNEFYKMINYRNLYVYISIVGEFGRKGYGGEGRRRKGMELKSNRGKGKEKNMEIMRRVMRIIENRIKVKVRS